MVPSSWGYVIDSPEIEIFQRKRGLDDTSGLHSWPQHVLLSRHIAWLDQSLQIIQVAEGEGK